MAAIAVVAATARACCRCSSRRRRPIRTIIVEVERGQALVTAGDCVACHTAPGGTPSPAAAASADAVRHHQQRQHHARPRHGHRPLDQRRFRPRHAEGIRPGGAPPLSRLPLSLSTPRSRRADIDAIFAYLRTLPPGREPRQPQHPALPVQHPRRHGRLEPLFFTPGEFKPDPTRSEEFNRGAYWSKAWAIAAPATRR